MKQLKIVLVLSFATALACGGESKEEVSPTTPEEVGSTGGKLGGQTEGGKCVPLTEPLRTDYTPDTDDDFPACISDEGKYVPFKASNSSSARSKAFEEIGAILFTPETAPSPDAFIAARMIYDEDEGIGSRVVRRYDPHFDAKDETDCTKEADVEANPDYCVGPAKLLPIVLDAFRKGATGQEPSASAGRIEGALLAFFAVSTYKESFSCSEKLEDCDSSYGYYDGAGLGIGLGGRIKNSDPLAYRAAEHGALAVRCWRDIDPSVPAEDQELRERARTQFDRAVMRGSLGLLVSRIADAKAKTGDARAFHWGFVSTFLHAIVSQVWRDPSVEDIVQQALGANSADDVDLDLLALALARIGTCGE